MIVGRIAAVAVMIAIGVVGWIHRRQVVRMMVRTGARRRRRHHRTIAVVVVAVVARTMVVTRARTDFDDHPRLVAIAVPAEAHWLEVFEGGEAKELVTYLVIWHHRVHPRGIRTVSRDADGDSLNPTRADPYIFLCIVVSIVRIEIDIDITSVGVIPNVLHIIIDSHRIGIIGQHGL